MALEGSRSTVSNNIAILCEKANCYRHDVGNLDVSRFDNVEDQTVKDNAGVIRDMISLKEGRDFAFFKEEEIESILVELCVG